ncbi:hypothetical protein EON65_15675 [archaeon]|nr:MAG: hypothetical protein EON65_15675 [archaeon]
MDTYADRLLDTIVCRGKGLGFGVISGPLVFSTDDAMEELEKGKAPILAYSDDDDTQTFRSLVKVSEISIC